VVDYKALAGDASDGIPGVKGVGAKTAAELLASLGDLDAIYAAAAAAAPPPEAAGASPVPEASTSAEEAAGGGEAKPKAKARGKAKAAAAPEGPIKPPVVRKLLADRDAAFLSRRLATIRTDLPELDGALAAALAMRAASGGGPDEPLLMGHLRRLELASLEASAAVWLPLFKK
jgi:5'-3' exonuclease